MAITNAEKMRRWRKRHPESNYKIVKAWKARHPEVHRARAKAYHRKWIINKKWNLSDAEWHSILKAQGGGCAICKWNSTEKNLSVDHCHETERIRGLLCGKCNRGLGMFLDSPKLLRKAARYLESDVTHGFTFKLLEDQ